MAWLSLMGILNWEPNLFEDMLIPDGVDRQILTDKIVLDCAELEVVYPHPQFLKRAITLWSKSQLESWNRFYTLANAEYNPLENYDREETETTGANRAHSGTDTVQTSGQQSENNTSNQTHSGQDSNVINRTVSIDGEENGTNSQTDTQQVSAYDSNEFTNREKTISNGENTREISNDSTETENASFTYGHRIADSDTKTASNSGTTSTIHGETITDSESRHSRIHGNIGVTTSQQMAEQELILIPKLNIYELISAEFKKRFCILVY